MLMGKGVKFRLTISILLFVLFFAQYVITHVKRKIIIKNNIFYGVEDGLFESKLSLKELTVPAGVKSIFELMPFQDVRILKFVGIT